MIHIDFPYHFDANGHTATTDWLDHALDLCVQALLTKTRERVNRPEFGTPLFSAVFEGNSPEQAQVIQFAAKATLQRMLGDAVKIVDFEVRSENAQLIVDLTYRLPSATTDDVDSRQYAIRGGTS